MRIGQKCASCRRPMRTSRTKATDAPGTVQDGGSGYCRPCRNAHAKGRELGYFKQSRPSHCKGCETPLRPRNAPAKDHPGTRQYGTGGYCTSCRSSQHRGLKTATPRRLGVIPCRGCERPTRGSGTLADHPGTVARRKHGFCGRCLRDGTAGQVLAMVATLQQWQQRRAA